MLVTVINSLGRLLNYSYDYSTGYDLAATSFWGVSSLISIIVCCVVLIVLIFWIFITYWVYKDATKRNVENPILWALLTFFLSWIGLIIYFLVGRNQSGTGTKTT